MSNGDLDVLIKNHDVNNHYHINDDFNSAGSDDPGSDCNHSVGLDSVSDLNSSENMLTIIQPSTNCQSQLEYQERCPLLTAGNVVNTPPAYQTVDIKMVKKETIVSLGGGETKLTVATSSGIDVNLHRQCGCLVIFV